LNKENWKSKEKEQIQCKSRKVSSGRNKNSKEKLDYATDVKFCILKYICNILYTYIRSMVPLSKLRSKK